MAPVLDEIARDGTGRLLVAKVDSDHAPGLSQRYSIRGIPTLIAFREGKEVDRQVGFDANAVRDLVERLTRDG